MSLRIVFDVRRARDFGIGTYIRGLLHGLGAIDQSNDYVLITLPHRQDAHADEATFAGLPPNFQTVTYPRTDAYFSDHVAFPFFVRRLAPSLVHIPLNRVPLFLQEPYVVTIHDMSSLLFETGSGLRIAAAASCCGADCCVRAASWRSRKPRGETCTMRWASPRIASAWPTMPRIRISSYPRPPSARAAFWNDTRSPILFCSTQGTFARKRIFPAWWKRSRWAREHLSRHPVYRHLHLIIIGDEISRYPSVRRAVIQTRVRKGCAFSRIRALRSLARFF
jgi:hypothetical protein